MDDSSFTSRSQVEQFFCPRCEAEPGARCIGARGKPRESCHAERHQRAHNVFDLLGSWPAAQEADRAQRQEPRADGLIDISFRVAADEIKGLTHLQRQAYLGERAAMIVDRAVVLPPNLAPWKGRYTEKNIRQAFATWAEHHGGLAPTKRDWSAERDPGPDHVWPRAERVAEFGCATSESYGIRTRPDDPHRRDKEHCERWYAGESGYCPECFHGSGCVPRDMSGWQFAVEVLAGLQVRTAGDFHSTKGQRDRYGRNRRMVTAGQRDVGPQASDPAVSQIIETIDPRR